MADVFISYARSDRSKAEALAHALEEQHLSVWWDRELLAGTAFDEAIERELDAAKCAIVGWSGASVESEWVRDEAEDARSRRIIVPVLFEDVRIPLRFRRLHAVDMANWDGEAGHDAVSQLVKAVRAFVDSPAKTTKARGAERRATRVRSARDAPDALTLHTNAVQQSAQSADRALFGGFIMTVFPAEQAMTEAFDGLQVFSEVNADVYVAMDDFPELVIQIDRRLGPHFGSTGMSLSDRSKAIIEFDGDAVYEPFQIQRTLATLTEGREQGGECTVHLAIFNSGIRLQPRQDKDEAAVDRLIDVLDNDDSRFYRIRAAEYLALIGRPDLLSVIANATEKESDPYAQACFARSLGTLGNRDAVPYLERTFAAYERKPSYGWMFEAALRDLGADPHE